MANKICKSCGEFKDSMDFYASKGNLDGRMGKCKSCFNSENLDRVLRRNYGITEIEYDSMRLAQNFCCAICGMHESKQERRLYVDHCHDTGRVRGLLCHRCNTSIGQFEGEPNILLVAYRYLGGESDR